MIGEVSNLEIAFVFQNHEVIKSRDITLLTKVHIVKAMVFPVVMYGYEKLDHKEG